MSKDESRGRICPSCGHQQIGGGRCEECETLTRPNDSRERFLAGLEHDTYEKKMRRRGRKMRSM